MGWVVCGFVQGSSGEWGCLRRLAEVTSSTAATDPSSPPLQSMACTGVAPERRSVPDVTSGHVTFGGEWSGHVTECEAIAEHARKYGRGPPYVTCGHATSGGERSGHKLWARGCYVDGSTGGDGQVTLNFQGGRIYNRVYAGQLNRWTGWGLSRRFGPLMRTVQLTFCIAIGCHAGGGGAGCDGRRCQAGWRPRSGCTQANIDVNVCLSICLSACPSVGHCEGR